MVDYQVCLVPCTMSPLIRDMHRQTIKFQADGYRHARKIVNQSFPGGTDGSGEWFVEPQSLKQIPADGAET